VYRILISLPGIGKFIYHSFLKKKTFPEQNEALIEQYPWKELKRQVLAQFSLRYRKEKYVFEVEKAHDQYVAKRIRHLKPDVFIGYEKSSLESFKEVKKMGGITVLDLAQVHYGYLIELRNSQETFQDLFEDEALFEEINQTKAAEYEYADFILTLSNFAKSTLLKFGLEEKKLRVVNLGYNPDIFKPKTRYQTSNTTLPLKLIYTGTFTRRKGVHLLLQALHELDNPLIQLTIVGPILDGEDLFEQYKKRFTYYDFLHHEDLVTHLQASDVYVFPSYLDSWAMTVVEAMATGLPVIVTENTGAKDAISDKESGFILPIGDMEALKKAILYFYNDRAEVERMGRVAARSAENFQWHFYQQQIHSFVDSLSFEAEV
jgi:glycosyltransferase involved in cell wall biosynthesis